MPTYTFHSFLPISSTTSSLMQLLKYSKCTLNNFKIKIPSHEYENHFYLLSCPQWHRWKNLSLRDEREEDGKWKFAFLFFFFSLLNVGYRDEKYSCLNEMLKNANFLLIFVCSCSSRFSYHNHLKPTLNHFSPHLRGNFFHFVKAKPFTFLRILIKASSCWY